MTKRRKTPHPIIDPLMVVYEDGDKIRRSFNQYKGGFQDDMWIAYRAHRPDPMGEVRHYAIVDDKGEIVYHETPKDALASLCDPAKKSVRQRLYGS